MRARLVLALVTVCVLAGALAVASHAHRPARGATVARQSTGRPPRTPSVFASMSSAAGYTFNLDLRSVATGRVRKVLTSLGSSWTNNGFALSPDGRYVYFTLIPKAHGWKSLLLEQISASTGRRRFIGPGEQPAVSPDGRLLAYATGEDRSASIVVRDLASSGQRSINVSRLLGKTDMLSASLAWVGDGRQLAVFEACCATLDAARGSSGTSARYASHLIVISIPRHAGLIARRIVGPAANQTPESAGPDTTRANTVLVSSLIRGDQAAVYRLTLGPSRATLNRVLTIAHAQVLGFDPTGRKLLYLLGHRPPNLWTATIANDHLVHRHLLIRNSKLDAIAW